MTFLGETPETTKFAQIFCEAFFILKNTYFLLRHPELITVF
jgi:hypothetical protein